MAWRKRHILSILHMPVQNAVSLHGSKNTVYLKWLTLEMSRFCFMTLKTRHILNKLHPIFYPLSAFCLNGGEERNVKQVIRAWNGCFTTGLWKRGIFPVYCTLYFFLKHICFKALRTRFEVICTWKKRYLSGHLRLIWAVSLHGFKIDAYSAIYHACRICRSKGP